jgi:hypothetical protein
VRITFMMSGRAASSRSAQSCCHAVLRQNPRLLSPRSCEKGLRGCNNLRLARICPHPSGPFESLDEYPANDSGTIDQEQAGKLIPSALHVIAVGLGRLEEIEVRERLVRLPIGNASPNSPVGLIRVDRSQLSVDTFGSPYAACVVIAGSAPNEIGTR